MANGSPHGLAYGVAVVVISEVVPEFTRVAETHSASETSASHVDGLLLPAGEDGLQGGLHTCRLFTADCLQRVAQGGRFAGAWWPNHQHIETGRDESLCAKSACDGVSDANAEGRKHSCCSKIPAYSRMAHEVLSVLLDDARKVGRREFNRELEVSHEGKINGLHGSIRARSARS